jgi:hypothetical protein
MPRWWRSLKRGDQIAISSVAVTIIIGLAAVIPTYKVFFASGVENPSRSTGHDATPLAPGASTSWSEPLSVNVRWPALEQCDGATEVAVQDGGPAPDTIRWAVQQVDVRSTIVDSGGVAWGGGFLTLLLSARGDAAISITSLKQVIFRSLPMRTRWVYTPQGGCGDIYERIFNLDLDGGTIEDAGTQGGVGSGQAPPSAPLGRAFLVTRTDPARIVVDAHSCRGRYEWGLRINYVVNGQERRLDVGSANAPFRSAGEIGHEIPTYTYSGDEPARLVSSGFADRPLACQSR